MSELDFDLSWLRVREAILAAPWHEWTHAYGAADDVPALLEALATGSQEERERAQHALYSNVFHQGTRWHASPRAVPFLLDMLALPIPDRAWLIEYLISLALGYEEEFLPHGIEPDAYFAGVSEADDLEAGNFSSDKSDEEEDIPGDPAMWRFGEFARDTFGAVEAGCDRFIVLLDDEDLRVRMAAAHALGWFRARADDASRALRERWPAMEEGERANALIAMSLQSRWATQMEREAWREIARLSLCAEIQAPILAEQLGAALVLASDGPLDPEPLQVLGEAVARGAELRAWQRARREELGASIYWNGGDLQSLAAMRLADVPPEQKSAAVEALARALESATPMTSLSLSHTLLLLAFPLDEDGQREIKREDLTRDQERALHAVLGHGAWKVGDSGSVFANYAEIVRAFGLPDSQEELRAWLENK